jgi:hypothetical protein
MKTESHNRRKFIAFGAILAALIVLASALLVGSGAIFTAKSANPQNVFSTGAFTLKSNKDWAAILSMDLMKPGDVVQGDVTIANVGTIAADFDLSMQIMADLPGTKPTAGHLLDVLQLTVYEGPVELYDGSRTFRMIVGPPLGDVVYAGSLKAFTGVKLSSFGPKDAHTYTFVVTFPDGGTPRDDDSGDNIYQGSSTTVEFDWNVVQQ